VLGSSLEAVFKSEHARLMAGVARLTRDLDLAEEAVQEAFVRASREWPAKGLPNNPAAWLTTVARNVAIDLMRKRSREVRTDVPETFQHAAAQPDDGADVLGLVFACCGAELSALAKMTLALRAVLGLSTREIARLLVEEEAATSQRLLRAKRELALRGERFEPPPRREWPHHVRLATTLVYLLFTEGYAASHGRTIVRRELAARAIDLGKLLCAAVESPATLGLLALMQLHHARADARVSAEGEILTLDEQDRSLWDRAAIREGLRLLDRAIQRTPRIGTDEAPDPFVLQAAIAALHCRAPSSADTDWAQIAALYGGLLRVQRTPIVELNAAVALAMTGKVDVGLKWINELERRDVLRDYLPLALAKAELLHRSGVHRRAERYFRRARRLATNAAERAHVDRRIRTLFGAG